MVESLRYFFIGAGAGVGVGEKNTRSRSKMDRLRNTGGDTHLILQVPDPDHKLAANSTAPVRCPLQTFHADGALVVLKEPITYLAR